MSNNISCDLTVFGNRDAQVRHEETSLSIIKHNEGIKELQDGYAFSYSSTQERFAALSQWITNESKCCPFFTFSLQLVSTNTSNKIWLEIRGSNEIKNYMEVNFKTALGIDLTAFKDPASCNFNNDLESIDEEILAGTSCKGSVQYVQDYYGWFQANILSKISAIEELPTGYEMVFKDQSPGFESTLLQFMVKDKKCCSSYIHALVIEPSFTMRCQFYGSAEIKNEIKTGYIKLGLDRFFHR